MSELRYAVAKENGALHRRMARCLDGGRLWGNAMKDVAALLEIPAFTQYIPSKRKLLLPPDIVIRNDEKLDPLFRRDKASRFYTPRLNLKKGKEINAKFLDIVAEHGLHDVEELPEILQELRMVNRSFYSGYRNVMLIEVEKRFYLRWEGDPTPSTQLTEVNDPTLIQDVEEAIAEATA